MVILSEIIPIQHIREGFEDADLDMIIVGYDREELGYIIKYKVYYDMVMLFLDRILTLDELLKYGKLDKFYGEPIDIFIQNLVKGKNNVLPALRNISNVYNTPQLMNNYMSLKRQLSINFDEFNTILKTENLYGELCRRIIHNLPLGNLKYIMTKHMYDFNPAYVRDHISLYKYLINVYFPLSLKYPNPYPSNAPYVSEIDMMKKMYGIPFINCNTKHIQRCYEKIINGNITMTLLINGNVNGTSDITYEDYYSDELIFLLWNKGKYRPYNIPDIMSCISMDDLSIKMVDPDGNIIEDTKYLCNILKPRLKPYITSQIMETYSKIKQEDLDPNDVYPMLINILKVVNHIIDIKELPGQLVDYILDNKEKCKEYLLDMYHMALYFRRWKGPGHPIPYRRIDADNLNVNPEILASPLIHKYRLLLKSGEILPFLRLCPSYKDKTIVPEHPSILNKFKGTINGTTCIRIASSRFLYTSHRIYTAIYGSLSCNIDTFEDIKLVAPEEL